MKISLFASALVVTLASALPQTIPVLTEYQILYKYCEGAGPNAYVGVLYADRTTTYFNYGECYPYEINHSLAQMAVFCKSVTCESNPNPDCTGGAVPPVSVLLPAGTTLVNVADFVQYIGQGATCQPNSFPVR